MIHVGDVGTVLRMTIVDQDGTVVDVSGASSKKILLRNHDHFYEKTAEFYTTGTDGIIQYAFQAGDLAAGGMWTAQAVVTLAGGTWHSDTTEFEVGENLA